LIHDNRQLQRESYRQDKEKDGFERKNKKPILTEHKNIKRMEFTKKMTRNSKSEKRTLGNSMISVIQF